MTKTEFLAYLTTKVQAYSSQKAAAQAWGISAPYLADVLRSRREPGPKLLDAVGVQRTVLYIHHPEQRRA